VGGPLPAGALDVGAPGVGEAPALVDGDETALAAAVGRSETDGDGVSWPTGVGRAVAFATAVALGLGDPPVKRRPAPTTTAITATSATIPTTHGRRLSGAGVWTGWKCPVRSVSYGGGGRPG
jgi:hypothetical protein